MTGAAQVYKPATFDIKTEQTQIQTRRDLWFKTVCPPVYTERFVKSLQRALRARGYYIGKPSGSLDAPTREAIPTYQSEQGLQSELLSLEAAEAFGFTSHRDFRAHMRRSKREN